jgi:hypothetical protein
MSGAASGWEPLLDADVPRGCSLKAVLLTTYEPPEETLLAEHLLQLLLKLERKPEAEGPDRQYICSIGA